MPKPESSLSDPPPRVMRSEPAPWSLDLRSSCLTWSDEVRSMHDAPHAFEPTLSQALGFIDPLELPELLSRAATGIRTGEPFEIELGIVTAAALRKRVHLKAWSLPDANRRPRLLEGTLRVIGEAAQEDGCGNSDARVAQLESALRDWEAFARAIPHELKTSMAIIEGFSAALYEREHGALSDRGQRHLDGIRRTAVHAKSLGEALLVLAPMSMQAMRWEHVDLSAIAWEFVDLLRNVGDRRTVEVEIKAGMRVTGDPDLLRLLVGNLLGNAWKFTSQRPVARIDFRVVAAGAHQAFCVSDNGVGFHMARAGELFAPLVRLHGPAEFEGSGIGLAIARRAVERHAGHIWADASEGEGAKFFFSLGAAPKSYRGGA